MTNTELKKTIEIVQREAKELRERLSILKDEYVELKTDLASTKNMIQDDLKRLSAAIERRRVL